MFVDSVALVTGADRGLGLGITEELLNRGWTVLAGQHMDWPELSVLKDQFPSRLHLLPLDVGSDSSVSAASELAKSLVTHLDMLVANAAINHSATVNSIRETQSYENMRSEFNVNALGALRVTGAFLPLIERSEMRRLCYVSSEAGSIGASTRTGWFGYCMSKAALNMAVKNLYNDLSSQGFTFRLYHPGWMRTYMSGAKNLDAHYEPNEAAQFALNHFLSESESSELQLIDWEGKPMPW